MRTRNPIYICIPDSGHASFVRASGSGFNPLAAEKRENEFRPRDGADQLATFFRFPNEKTTFLGTKAVLSTRNIGVPYVQLLFEK